MKSSVAIFSNQGNPFSPTVKSRSHHRPTQPKMVSKEQKRTVPSPVHLPHHLSEALSPPDLNFLGGSQRFVSGLPESDSSGPFDESWPSSEDSSKTPEQDRMQTGIRGGYDQTKEDSVIARYMARFRTGPPTNRLERSPPPPAMKEFWWLQTSPDSPDVHRFRPGSGISADLGFSLQSLEFTPPLEEPSMSDSKVCPEDVDIFRLQERARKLILQSESSLNSGDPVSSDGVGSSPSSASDVSRIRSSPLERAPVIPIQRTPVVLPTPSVRTHATIPPEEDILYQWRLRRKMEQAREGAISLSTCKRSSSPPVRIPKVVLPSVETSETPFRVVPPVAAKSSHATEYAQSPICFSQVPLASPNLASYSLAGIVPPHLHLQCDVLPCIHSQHPAPCTKQKQETKAVNPMAVPADSPAPLAKTGQSVQSAEKIKSVCKQPSEKPRRRRDRPVEKNTTSKGDNSKGTSTIGRPVTPQEDLPPPSSPVHQAMEQVISERLFSSLQSPKLKPRKRSSAPPKVEKEELQPQEIAASLLEEAEDSDGTEFRDDPLLEVLREQRQSLRVRLREVDLQLAELEGENKENQSQPQ